MAACETLMLCFEESVIIIIVVVVVVVSWLCVLFLVFLVVCVCAVLHSIASFFFVIGHLAVETARK